MISRLTSRRIAIALLTLVSFILIATVALEDGHAPLASANPGGPVRGQAGDLWADAVLGQPDFREINPGPIVPDKVAIAHGVIMDRAQNKFYVLDGGDNRILGFDAACLNRDPNHDPPCSANKVLGQPDLNSAACNGDSGYQSFPDRAPPSASSLCSLQEWPISPGESGSGSSMAINSQGDLFVTDFWNNRVLRYNNPYGTNTARGEGDSVADDVWGQNDFTHNSPNKGNSTPDATSFHFNWGDSNNWTAGVDIGPDGSLWVVDNGNNRVLRFPVGTDGNPSHTADLVLGQPGFTSSAPGTALNQMHDPNAVRVMLVNGEQWVYVGEHNNARVDIFKPSFYNGKSASITKSIGPQALAVTGVEIDPAGQGIWVIDQGDETLQLWDKDLSSAQPITSITDAALHDPSGSLGFDNQGDIFVSVRGGYIPGHDWVEDVVVFRKQTDGTYSQPPVRLFDNDTPRATARDSTGWVDGVQWTKSPSNSLGVSSQLFSAEHGRLIFWNNPNPATMQNYQAANGYLNWRVNNNSQNAIDPAGGFSSFNYECCTAVAASGGYLWVGLYTGGDDRQRVLVYALPVKSGDFPVREITFPIGLVSGSGNIDNPSFYGELWGLAPTSDSQFLWISQVDGSRVFRVRNPLTAPLVDVVLGQTSSTGTQCNRGLKNAQDPGVTGNMLCDPGSLALDRFGDLYVSDDALEIVGNMRLLEFDAANFPSDNSQVIYASDSDPRTFASKVFWTATTSPAGFRPAFDSQNEMVLGYDPYWRRTPVRTESSRNPGRGGPAGSRAFIAIRSTRHQPRPTIFSRTTTPSRCPLPSTIKTTCTSATTTGPGYWFTRNRWPPPLRSVA